MALTWFRRRRLPSREEIEVEQRAEIARVLAAVNAGQDRVRIGGRLVSAEAAWAAATSIETAWSLRGRYDGQRQLDDGSWIARVEWASGRIAEIAIGRFARRVSSTRYSDETEAITVWGLAARGRTPIYAGIYQEDGGGYSSGVRCRHGVSIFGACFACRGGEIPAIVRRRLDSGADDV